MVPPKKRFYQKKNYPPQIFFGPFQKKWNQKKIDPFIKFLFYFHGDGDTIRFGQEIQCLAFAGFVF